MLSFLGTCIKITSNCMGVEDQVENADSAGKS